MNPSLEPTAIARLLDRRDWRQFENLPPGSAESQRLLRAVLDELERRYPDIDADHVIAMGAHLGAHDEELAYVALSWAEERPIDARFGVVSLLLYGIWYLPAKNAAIRRDALERLMKLRANRSPNEEYPYLLALGRIRRDVAQDPPTMTKVDAELRGVLQRPGEDAGGLKALVRALLKLPQP
jgi:hypothetical protein